MSNFGVLRETILGCVTRAKSSFQAGQQNFADIAINNAIIKAQRNWDFSYLKGQVKITCNPRGNVLNAIDDCGCPVQLKSIIKAFGNLEPTGHCDVGIPYLSRQSQVADNTAADKNGCCGCGGVRVIRDGEKVYLSPRPQPESDPYDLWFYAVKWLPRVTKDTDTNFLFVYGFDYLMYQSIVELNFYIKEDERFQVSTRMLQDVWQSLVAWDVSLVSPTETEIEL